MVKEELKAINEFVDDGHGIISFVKKDGVDGVFAVIDFNNHLEKKSLHDISIDRLLCGRWFRNNLHVARNVMRSLKVDCPQCNVKIGQPCIHNQKTMLGYSHIARENAALAAGF